MRTAPAVTGAASLDNSRPLAGMEQATDLM
jgi:hypothetical protein